MCAIDRTCDVCAFWSAAQWELFVKKRSYIDRMKPSCPSGYVPPAPLASPRAETPSGGFATGTSSSSLSHPSGGQGSRRGSQDAPGIVSWRASSPPAGSRSSERGGSASVARERALTSLAPSGAGEGGVARSQRSFFCARCAPRLSLIIPLRTLDDVGNCGRLRRIATAFYPLVVPDLRIVVHGWIRELVPGRVVFVDRGRLSRFRSSSRYRSEVESVEVGNRRVRYLLVSGRFASGGGLLTATSLDVCALNFGETGLDPRIDTGLAVTALGVPGRGCLTSTGHIVSVRVFPARRGDRSDH